MVTPRQLFDALESGERMWFSTSGNSMWPLVRSGESIWVEKAAPSDLRVGELAMVECFAEVLVAHVISQVHPLVTTSLMGVRDAPGARPLGRVIAVKKWGRVWPVSPWFSVVAPHVPLMGRQLKKVPGLTELVRWLRAF
jgi:hypothetical protein